MSNILVPVKSHRRLSNHRNLRFILHIQINPTILLGLLKEFITDRNVFSFQPSGRFADIVAGKGGLVVHGSSLSLFNINAVIS